MAQQRFQRIVLESVDLLVVATGLAREKVSGEDGNVLPPVTQRGKTYLDRVQAIEQVLAELAVRD